jgi:GT2 family glycosyltransferase
MSPIRLAIVLLNWRQEQQTLACVRAVLAGSTVPASVIVVDNESTNASYRALSTAIPANNLIASRENRGYAGGNNLGIRRALELGAEYVLLLNTDAEITPTGLSRLLDRLDAHPQISILGPAIIEGNGHTTKYLVGGRDIARHLVTRIAMPADGVTRLPGYPVREVDYVPGTVFLARTSVLRKIGLLDETYFFSGEIADLCKRARDSEHKVCVDLEVEGRHDLGRTPMHLRETLYVYYSLRNRFLYVKKHHARVRRRYFAYWTIVGLVALVRALWQGKSRRARAVVLALWHAYGGHYGNQNASFPSA